MSRIPQPVVEHTAAAAYVSERKIYPRDVSGPLNRLRMAALIWLLGMFYLLPWVRWNGHQAILFDLPARKFHVFSITFWPGVRSSAATGSIFITPDCSTVWCNSTISATGLAAPTT